MLKLASCLPTLTGQKVMTLGGSCLGTAYEEPQLSARRDRRLVWRRVQDKSLEATMACVICESDRTQPVWRQGNMRIDECKGCGVFFTVERPTEKRMMALYDGNTLIRERPIRSRE